MLDHETKRTIGPATFDIVLILALAAATAILCVLITVLFLSDVFGVDRDGPFVSTVFQIAFYIMMAATVGLL